QPGEAIVEIVAAQHRVLVGAISPLLNHAGLPQGAEVVRHRRLADGEAERAARAGLAVLGEHPDHCQPRRVAQCMHHSGQLDFVLIWVVKVHLDRMPLYDTLRTSLVRLSSYYRTSTRGQLNERQDRAGDTCCDGL